MKQPMPSGQRKVGQATCRVRQCNALPAAMRPKTRELVSLHVPTSHRNQGYATTLMYKVCREADAAGLTLLLWPKAYDDLGGLSDQYLEGWYAERFGFHRIQQNPVLMARMPGSTPRLLELTPITAALQRAKGT